MEQNGEEEIKMDTFILENHCCVEYCNERPIMKINGKWYCITHVKSERFLHYEDECR